MPSKKYKETVSEAAASKKLPTKNEKEKDDDDDDNDSSSYSSDDDDDDDDDLILEGVLIRNPDVSDSDDTTSSEEDDDDEDEDDEDRKLPPKKKSKSSSPETDTKSGPSTNSNPKSKSKNDKLLEKKKAKTTTTATTTAKTKKKKRKVQDGPDIVHVDFIFCDMNEKFFHGIKTLLSTVSPLLANHSSALTDLMLENASVGTVTSTEGDTDGTVFGFASVLNIKTHQEEPCIQSLKKICFDKCPTIHQRELQIVLSGSTKRPAGFYFHGRMVNMPLEIVQVLHEQLVIDMDWAVNNARGSEEMRKSLDFGAFILFAPTYKVSGNTYYKWFDDETFATHAEFTFEIELPKPYGSDETPFCNVVIMTKTGHRTAMKALADMVGTGNGGGTGST